MDAQILAPPVVRVGPARRVLGGAGLALLLAGLAVLATEAAAGPSPAVRVPAGRFTGWVAGPLAGLADAPPSRVVLAAALALAVAGYALVLAAARDLPVRWIVGGVLAAHLVALLAPPLFTSDVFSYIAYARMEGAHLDPYAAAPVVLGHDPIRPWVGWLHIRSAYGPLFTLLSAPAAAVSNAAALWAFKVIAALASLVVVALVWWAAPRRDRAPGPAVALVGLNPVLLVFAVGGAHNDLLLLLGMTGAVALVLAGRDVPAGIAAVAAAGLKLTAVVVLPFLVLGSPRRGRVALGALIGALLAGALALAAFGHDAGGFLRVLAWQQGRVSASSLPALTGDVLGVAPATLLPVFKAAGALALAGLVAAAWRGADWLTCAAWALVAVTATTSWLMPWYAVWALPLCALCRSRSLTVAVLALQALLVARLGLALA